VCGELADSPVGRWTTARKTNLTRHPVKWTRNKVELVAAAIVLAHIGTLIVVGLYYLLFEVYAPFTHAWHAVVPGDGTRHLLRNVYEGVLGGTLVQFVVFNHFAKRRTTVGRLDRQEMKLHIPNLKDDRPLSGWQLLVSPLLVLVYAIPGFLVGAGVAWLMRHEVTTAHNYALLVGAPTRGHSLWSPIHSLWTANKDEKVVGFFASVFLGRRPVRRGPSGLLCGPEGRSRKVASRLSPAELPGAHERGDRPGCRRACREHRRVGLLPSLAFDPHRLGARRVRLLGLGLQGVGARRRVPSPAELYPCGFGTPSHAVRAGARQTVALATASFEGRAQSAGE